MDELHHGNQEDATAEHKYAPENNTKDRRRKGSVLFGCLEREAGSGKLEAD